MQIKKVGVIGAGWWATFAHIPAFAWRDEAPGSVQAQAASASGAAISPRTCVNFAMRSS